MAPTSEVDVAKAALRRSGHNWSRHGYAGGGQLEHCHWLEDTFPRLGPESCRADLSTPAVFTGLTDSWRAARHWDTQELARRFGAAHFKVGRERRSRQPVLVGLQAYLVYAEANTDDEPLYIFDDSFAERSDTERLSECVAAPSEQSRQSIRRMRPRARAHAQVLRPGSR